MALGAFVHTALGMAMGVATMALWITEQHDMPVSENEASRLLGAGLAWELDGDLYLEPHVTLGEISKALHREVAAS